MKILQLYNNYKSGGGGETVMAEFSVDLLRQHGHEVHCEWRDNASLHGLRGKLDAFYYGIYSAPSYAEVSAVIRSFRPDVVLTFNVYPLLSPAALQACHDQRVPVIYSVQNHQMTCPTAAHFVDGELCERCLGKSEIHAVLHNCKENLLQSAAYALRSAVARKKEWFFNDVTFYMAISEAVRGRMLRAGYPPERIRILPNCVHVPSVAVDPSQGAYVGFLGRLSSEKGLNILLEAAERTQIPLRIAGSGQELEALRAKAPKNVSFVGWLGRESVAQFYAGARFTVVPSLWPEPFGLVATEAMSYGLPVVAARSGALPEITDHEQTGLLYEPRNVADLASCLQRLWHDPQLCNQLGAQARAVILEHYNSDLYYRELLAAFEDAQRLMNSSGSPSLGENSPEVLQAR